MQIKIADLKIGIQLKISFGIILLLIIMLGAVSWNQSDRLAQQTDDLYEHPLKVRRALGELEADILTLQLEYRNLLLAGDERVKQTAQVNTDLSRANAERNFEILSDRYLGPPSDVVEARTAFLKWVSLLDADSELAKSGKISEALSRLERPGDLVKERERMLAAVSRISAFAANKADQLHANSVELKRSLDRQLAFMVFGFLALALLVVTILINHIIKPIKQLTDVTRKFGEGKFETRSSYLHSNEYGALAKSFNSLAQTIQNEIIFKDRSAKLNSFMLKGLESNAFRLQVLKPLMKLTHSQVGAVYLLNEQKTHFEHLESIGMEVSEYKSYSANNFEGEFGMALASKKIEHIKNIPEDTHHLFSTVGGVLMPKEIITIPLVDKQEIIAMISLSSLQEYDTIALRLVTDMQGALAAWMNAMIASRKMIKMAENLKIQNVELETQKKELAAQSGELIEQNTELEMQKKQLAESNQLKSSFLSNMSHELRTPLNSVIALSGVLNRRLADKIGPDEFGYLNVIERNGKHLLLLINDILDLSRIEAGYEELKLNTFCPNELIQEIVDLIEPQAKQKNLRLSYVANENLPLIRTDYEKSRHILQNIVANAIKFTEKGEVTITSSADAHTLKIEVKDTGIGIEKEFIPKVFDEFRQADGSNARKYGGTGLGMAIAKKYAEFLGGNITVESELGKGSNFTLIIPLLPNKSELNEHLSDDNRNYDKKEVSGHVSLEKKETKTILIVEDSEAILVQLKDMLASEGYKWMVARNGNQALEQIATKVPDAMILDLMMPEVDGFEVLRIIREKEETIQLPVVILTAKYVTKEELAFLKHNNIHQVIQKGDINKTQFVNAVSRMLFPVGPDINHSAVVAEPKPASYDTSLHKNPNRIILVIEDNPDNMLTIKALLSGYGEIIEACDGTIGTEMALKYHPDLILMDIALPGINGIEALRAIRREKSLQSVPIIAVSASAMKGDREQFIASGFDNYISKPIENEIFIRVTSEYICAKSEDSKPSDF